MAKDPSRCLSLRRIRSRLFLTATSRHYDLRRRDREGDARLVYSMDAPEIYGPVAHQLTFAVSEAHVAFTVSLFFCANGA